MLLCFPSSQPSSDWSVESLGYSPSGLGFVGWFGGGVASAYKQNNKEGSDTDTGTRAVRYIGGV